MEDDSKCTLLNKVLKIAATEKNINRFNRNLEYNGTPLSADEFISLFKKEVDIQAKAEREEMNNTDYSHSDYDIVLIDSFETAKHYSKYTSWCITQDETTLSNYLGKDGTFYFALKHGFEDIECEAGNNAPLDEYGLSMLAICVDGEGNLKTCTCRWNHYYNGNDEILTATEISRILGVNFKETFVPSPNKIKMSYEVFYDLCRRRAESVYYNNGTEYLLMQDPDNDERVYDESYFAKYILINQEGSTCGY